METNQDVPRPFYILSQAITYLIGGMFLLSVSGSLEGRVAVIAEVFGFILIGGAILFLVSSFFPRLVRWASTVDKQLFLGLFFVNMANLAIIAVTSTKYRAFSVVLVVAFLLSVVVAELFWLVGPGVSLGTRIRSRVAWGGLLRRVSVVLSLFALVMVIAEVNIMGGPILYLAVSLVCLSVASLL